MKHYYIDTNVIIDMLADRGEFAEAASNLFYAAGRGEICVYISSLSYSNKLSTFPVLQPTEL